MVQFIIGGAGSGKSQRLMEKIRQLIPREPDCIILVPEQFSYEFDKKLYRFIGAEAFNQLETHSFTSISRMLFQKYGRQTGEYADNNTRKTLLFQAIQNARQNQVLHFFGRQCTKTDFMQEVEQIVSVLRRNGTTAAALYETAMGCTGRLHDKLQDIALIYQEYEQLLAENHLQDALTDITEAAAIANIHDFFLGKTILIDEFESFTEDEYAMLEVMISAASDFFITLRTESDTTADDTLFATVNHTRNRIQQLAKRFHIACSVQVCDEPKRFANADLVHLNQQIFRPLTTGQKPEAGSHIHIFEARDAVEELEYVCATIRRLLMERKELHCSDIAILTGDLSCYTAIVHHAFEKYELPFYLDTAVSILHHPFSAYLLTLLELVQHRTFRTEHMFRYAKTGFTDCDWLSLSYLENYCYQWNVKGKTWESPFPSDTVGAEQAEIARVQLLEPLLRLRTAFAACKTGADFCNIFYSYLQKEGILERLSRFCEAGTPAETILMQQNAKYIWEQFVSILDCLYNLYGTKPMQLSEFGAVFSYLFGNVTYATPPRTLDAVFIGQTGRSRLRDPKIVFVIHCSEGVFPSTGMAANLFSEREYRLMEEKEIVIRKELQQILADERLAVYKTLSSASEELYLTYPLVNTANQKNYPSSVIPQIKSMFANGEQFLQTEQDLPLPYYAVTLRSAYYRYVRSFSTGTPEIAALQSVLMAQPEYRQKIEYLKKVHQTLSFAITDPSIMERLMGKRIIMTASLLEQYQLCPFQFFCNSGLRLYQRQRIQLDAANRGSLIHHCLEQILQQHDRETFLTLSQEALRSSLEQLAGQFWAEMLGGEFSKVPRAFAMYDHMLHDLFTAAQHVQQELQQTAFYPRYLELPIHHSNPDFPPLKARTRDGHTLQVEGIVDRVDVCEIDGESCVRIVDYKSGVKNFALGHLLYGLDLQMLIYLFSIVYNETPLQNAKMGGILYKPTGSVKQTRKRGDNTTKEEQEQAAYKMNGLLIQDPAIIQKMEPTGKGIYIPAKLKTGKTGLLELDNRVGTFLSESQFRALYHFVMNTLLHTAERIYAGDIAANPLIASQKDACQYCDYQDICGNLHQQPCRKITARADDLKKEMLAELERIEQEGEQK